jgi:competence protein ComEA
MRPRPGSGRLTPAHQEALDRRLALLESEVAGMEHTRVRPVLRALPDLPEQDRPEHDQPEQDQPVVKAPVQQPADPPVEQPPALPVPGRHAAPRRLRHRWRAGRRLPVLDRGTGGAGRWTLGPSQLLVVALVVALGLAVTAWWVVRAEPEPVPTLGTVPPAAPLVPGAGGEDPGAPAGTGQPAGPGATPVATAAAAPEEVVVHVAGKVRRPGLVVLPVGARVADAVDAAGGSRRGADLTTLNLARLLVDGEQVLVGVPQAGGAPGAVPPGTAPLATELVNLNTADQALLETLPGVGPVTAAAILDWRTEHGGFTAVEELLEVDGIGDATLADLSPLVTV